MKKILLTNCLLICCFAIISCSDNTNSNNICDDGKCDSPSKEQLTEISLKNIGFCWGTLDTSTSDPFYQKDKIYCGFKQIILPLIGNINRIYGTLPTNQNQNPSTTTIESSNLDGSSKLIGEIHPGEGYPFTISLTFSMDIAYQSNSSSYDKNAINWGFNYAVADRNTLGKITVDAPIAIDLPFDIWPIVLWPDENLQKSCNNGDISDVIYSLNYEFNVESAPLNISGNPVNLIPYKRSALFSGENINKQLGSNVFYILVPRGGFNGNDPQIALTITDIEGNTKAGKATITGPGYYLVNSEGNGNLAQTEQLVWLENSSNEADDPCKGSCSDTQVCVMESCVEKNEQIQAECKHATAYCDLGENSDCAEEHFCSGYDGFCHSLACQEQTITDGICNRPYGICENNDDSQCPQNHLCVDGICRNIECQTQTDCSQESQGYCTGEDPADCPTDHECVNHKCKKISCQ